MLRKILKKLVFYYNLSSISRLSSIYTKFKDFTMIGRIAFNKNLLLIKKVENIKGDIVECGVWRGGMIGGIAFMLGDNREYWLFDSFEGLPDVENIDGLAAKKWQTQETEQPFFDNCTADISYAQKSMKKSKVSNYHIIKGWFQETLSSIPSDRKIAVLRLDGDWYSSTYTCLESLFPMVVNGGIIILDDYLAWEGCRKAVHDYLSNKNLPYPIKQFHNEIYFIHKEYNGQET